MFLTSLRSPEAIPPNVMLVLLETFYPVNVAQSTITTGLIVYRIYTQHRQMRAAGLRQRGIHGSSLLNLVRIIVESAAIFTIQQIVLLILLQIGSPAQSIFHVTVIPSIGTS